MIRSPRRALRRFVGFALFAVLVTNPTLPGVLADQIGSLRAGTAAGSATGPFLKTNPDGPLRWQTCDTIRVLVNPGPFGADAVDMTRAALRRLNTLTGLRFSIVGTTSEIPSSTWYRAAFSDGEIPPVLIGFVPRSASDLFTTGHALAGTVANPVGGERPRLVTGALAVDAAAYAAMTPGFGTGRTQGVVLLHELGHLVGLAHTDGLMDAELSDATPAGFSSEIVTRFQQLRPDCPNRKA